WADTHDGPQTYPNIHITWDVPITMSDGTVLKANLYRPADSFGLPAPIATPAVGNMTPDTKRVSNLSAPASEGPGLSAATIGLARESDTTGTPLAGVTDLTKARGGGELRNFPVDRSLVRGGYAQVVVDVRGTGFSQGGWD